MSTTPNTFTIEDMALVLDRPTEWVEQAIADSSSELDPFNFAGPLPDSVIEYLMVVDFELPRSTVTNRQLVAA